MKSLKLFLFAFAALTMLFVAAPTEEVSAQTGYFLSSPTHANIDTVDNTEALSQIKQITGYHKVLSIQSTITKISGTVAGSVVLMGSLNGVTYDTVSTAELFYPTNVATQTKVWALGVSDYVYYKVIYTGAGTMSAKIQTYYILRD